MTAEQIRSRAEQQAESINERFFANKTSAENAMVILAIDQLRMQGEIAAQLAELNAKMAKVGDKSVFESVFGSRYK